MGIEVVIADNDWLGVGDPNTEIRVVYHSSLVVEAPHTARHYAYHAYDEVVAHVVKETLGTRDRYGKTKVVAVCGLESHAGAVFEIHERGPAFRDHLAPRHKDPVTIRKRYRLCKRCIQ